jgi:uncharacterized membrane-anchored protein YhcB (DUF1043 family)
MNLWKASTIGLVLAFGVVVGGSAVKLADAEPQAHMHTALTRLKEAHDALKSAVHDHGGHRAKALELTNKAIKEVEEGIAWAKEHDGKDPKEPGKDPKDPGKDPNPKDPGKDPNPKDPGKTQNPKDPAAAGKVPGK